DELEKVSPMWPWFIGATVFPRDPGSDASLDRLRDFGFANPEQSFKISHRIRVAPERVRSQLSCTLCEFLLLQAK
ncbi:hypothetical protein, partial [Ensifer sp. Root127]|uniref:hypothetical protein n=1 Tax=Ensifer sp. Root127 TaxID=1736440 RepID=UPI001AECF783